MLMSPLNSLGAYSNTTKIRVIQHTDYVHYHHHTYLNIYLLMLGTTTHVTVVLVQYYCRNTKYGTQINTQVKSH